MDAMAYFSVWNSYCSLKENNFFMSELWLNQYRTIIYYDSSHPLGGGGSVCWGCLGWEVEDSQ